MTLFTGMSPVTSTVTSTMLLSLLVGGVVTVAAIAAHDAQRAANRAVRWVWVAAIALTMGLTLAAPWRRPDAKTRIALPAATTTAASSISEVPRPWWQIAARRSQEMIATPVGAALERVEASLDALPTPVHGAVIAGWLLASIATMLAFVLSYRRVRRQVDTWPTTRVADITARVSPGAGPAVIGLAPAEIILPSWLLECSQDEQALVIAHESEHVAARDPWLLVFACAAVACMPWHPALWFALHRLRLAVELDCDRRVLRRGIPASAYGTLLIDLSALHPALPSAMPAFSCNGSYLERRLVAMTSRPSRFAAGRRLAGGLVATAALLAACESKLPTSAEVERMDAATAERALVATGEKKAYVVDGKRVAEAEAKQIASERIASVAVAKGSGDVNEIRITTRQGAELAAQAAAGKRLTLSPVKEESSLTPRMKVACDTCVVSVNLSNPTGVRKKFDGLLLVDGKIVDAAEFERITPDRIASVEVVKGSAAQQAYTDPRAANGVIKVTLKK